MTKCEWCKKAEAVIGVVHLECFFLPRLRRLHYIREMGKPSNKPLLLCNNCYESHKRNLKRLDIKHDAYDITEEKVAFT